MAKVKDKLSVERYLKKIDLIRSGVIPVSGDSPEQKAIRIAKAKKDVRYFVQEYLPHYATSESADFQIEWANMVGKDKVFRGFAEWGRALAKSVWNNIIIPLWRWINGDPTYLVIIGNSYDKAEQLLEDIKAEFEANPKLIADFGEQKRQGTWEDGFFITQSGFIGQALGMGQSVRGLRIKSLRPTHISCDDLEDKALNKNPKRQNEMVRWIERDLIPTMDGTFRRFTYSNNRFAPRMIQSELQIKHPKWKVQRINAYDPVTYKPTWHQKYDANYYKLVEEDLGTLPAMAEYNNTPHVEGEIFKEEETQWCKLPALSTMLLIVGHWDIAYAGTSTADYNAVRIWALKETDFYYVNSFVKQSKMRAALDWMCEFQKLLPPTVMIHWRYESQFWNDEVQRTIMEAERDHRVTLNLVKVDTPRTHKYDRILSLKVYYQNARIWYNEKLKSHNDTQVGLAQLYSIEPGYKSHDDAPDADEQAISYLSRHIRFYNYSAPTVGRAVSRNQY